MVNVSKVQETGPGLNTTYNVIISATAVLGSALLRQLPSTNITKGNVHTVIHVNRCEYIGRDLLQLFHPSHHSSIPDPLSFQLCSHHVKFSRWFGASVNDFSGSHHCNTVVCNCGCHGDYDMSNTKRLKTEKEKPRESLLVR